MDKRTEKILRKIEPNYLRLPPWLRVALPKDSCFARTDVLVNDLNLRTVCRSARCPNIFECYSRNTATFLILGGICSRSCAFCNIGTGKLMPPDPDEPERVALAASKLNLSHVVITSVARDDLSDGGSSHFAATVRAVRGALPQTVIEVLIPDFKGNPADLETVLKAQPDILNHNVETVPELYSRIRPQAYFAQSLTLLRRARQAGLITKSGLMVGLGENDATVRGALDSLASVNCQIVTVGQYLRPSRQHPPVRRYVHPDVFEAYAVYGCERGIPHVFSAPLVRSSYNAKDVFIALTKTQAGIKTT
jgi:lipoic acid synthetase